MRKIITQEERERKNKRNRLIIGGILIVVLVFSYFGYAFGTREETSTEKIEYNGVEFVKDQSGYWQFTTGYGGFMTRYNPKEVENISFLAYSSLDSYRDKPLYIVSDFNEPNFEIYTNLDPFVLKIQGACLDKECEKDLPIKDCSVDNVLIIKEPVNGSQSIYQQENCVFIIANLSNQTRYTDAFLFKIIGI